MTLRRLMPNTAGKSLDEIKQYHQTLITERLSARRLKNLEEKRKMLFKESDGGKDKNLGQNSTNENDDNQLELGNNLKIM